MNEEIEELFPAQSNINKDYTVDVNQIFPEQVEAIAVDENGKVEAISIDYNEYRNKLISIYKKTTLENSIISTFSVDDNSCNHTVILREINGSEKLEIEKSFEYNSKFINACLVLMVEDYNKENTIFNSTIEVLDENKANFIARTKYNDSLILIGISIELANMFKDIVTRNEVTIDILDKKTMDEKGIGSNLAIILTIIAISMVLLGTVIFTAIS